MAKKDQTPDAAGTPADDKKKKPEKHKPRTPREKAIAFVRCLWPIVVIIVIVFGLRSSLVDWNDVPSGSMRPTIIEGDRIFVNKLSYDLKFPFTQWRLARWGDPQRGDIVVWLHPNEGNWMGPTRLVKRVIGLPGDTIELRDCSGDPNTPGLTKLVINGKEMEYEPASAPASVPNKFIEYQFKQDGRVRTGRRAIYTENLDGVRHLVASVPAAQSGKQAFDPRTKQPILDDHGNIQYDGVPRSFGPITVPAGHYFLMGDNRDESKDCRYWSSLGYVIPEDNILGRANRVVVSLGDYWLPRTDRFFLQMP